LFLLSGRQDISLKYAATLSAEGFGCVLFFLLQLGREFFYGELEFLVMMGVPSVVASFLAYVTFSACTCSICSEENSKNNYKIKIFS
jgi:hypothetical protein